MENKRIKSHAIYLLFFALFMLTMSYASVPLYKLFCQVTGYGGTPMIVEKNNKSGDFGNIKIRFDSSIEKNSPISFKPKKKILNVTNLTKELS